MSGYLFGTEIDTDELVRGLRELADGVESGTIPVCEAGMSHEVSADDPSEESVTVTYLVPRESGPLDIIQYQDNE